MRFLLICTSVLFFSGCHKDGDKPIICLELSEGAKHESVIEVARSLSEAGFWKIENSLPSKKGSYPNIGLYRLDGTKIYLIGERIDRDGAIWPPASISYYGNTDNENLNEWVFLTLDLLEEYDLDIGSVCGGDEAQMRTSRIIEEWRDGRPDANSD